eukprot:scaffold423903_cov31-Prasinocladus_malaysianus.AAC.1
MLRLTSLFFLSKLICDYTVSLVGRRVRVLGACVRGLPQVFQIALATVAQRYGPSLAGTSSATNWNSHESR